MKKIILVSVALWTLFFPALSDALLYNVEVTGDGYWANYETGVLYDGSILDYSISITYDSESFSLHHSDHDNNSFIPTNNNEVSINIDGVLYSRTILQATTYLDSFTFTIAEYEYGRDKLTWNDESNNIFTSPLATDFDALNDVFVNHSYDSPSMLFSGNPFGFMVSDDNPFGFIYEVHEWSVSPVALPVPEPSSYALMIIAIGGLVWYRKNKYVTA